MSKPKTAPRPSNSGQQTRVAARSTARLGGYLTAALGATGLASVECEAAVVSIDVTSLGLTTGANAGVSFGSNAIVNNFLGLSGRQFNVSNGLSVGGGYYPRIYGGLRPGAGTVFATNATNASPTKFLEGASVGSSANFIYGVGGINSVFYLKDGNPYRAANFTLSPANFIGFRVAANGTTPAFNDATQFHYGYFQVTWNQTANEFRILSGAYESTPNTPIVTPAVVPEPSTMAAAGVAALALGAGAIRKARRFRKAEAAS